MAGKVRTLCAGREYTTSASGEIKITHFGLPQPPGANTEMGGGMASGTVAYLAPEQARGDAVGEETDVYSLGYVERWLAGEPPVEAPEGPVQKRQLMRADLKTAVMKRKTRVVCQKFTGDHMRYLSLPAFS